MRATVVALAVSACCLWGVSLRSRDSAGRWRRPESRLERVRRIYDVGARRYDLALDLVDRFLFTGGREWVAGQARGEVLEIAAGTGRNLRFYPEGVRLTLLELSSGMLAIARQRAAALGLAADIRQGNAEALEFPDSSFDTVTATLAFCTIPDEERALRQAVRVLRRGGRLVLLEHVRSDRRVVRLLQRLAEPLANFLVCDHLLRDPLDHLPALGMQVERLERSRLGIVQRLTARKPVGAARADQ